MAMLPKGHYDRHVARKTKCAQDIKIYTSMGNRVAARVARAEWQRLHAYITKVEADHLASIPPIGEWKSSGSEGISTQNR